MFHCQLTGIVSDVGDKWFGTSDSVDLCYLKFQGLGVGSLGLGFRDPTTAPDSRRSESLRLLEVE